MKIEKGEGRGGKKKGNEPKKRAALPRGMKTLWE